MEIKLELQNAQNAPEQTSPKKRGIDSSGRAYATGRRKTATARVWLKKGKGKITVNSKTPDAYFQRETLSNLIKTPFVATDTIDKYDVFCTVAGSGKSAQAGAIRHAISRSLTEFNVKAYRVTLRSAGFLTRDPRAVERKKYGKKKARKSFQFSKR